tara:strand:+ start:166 stop:429 length:264 start_codon:yes stop_codon:yes gene_type:complete
MDANDARCLLRRQPLVVLQVDCADDCGFHSQLWTHAQQLVVAERLQSFVSRKVDPRFRVRTWRAMRLDLQQRTLLPALGLGSVKSLS